MSDCIKQYAASQCSCKSRLGKMDWKIEECKSYVNISSPVNLHQKNWERVLQESREDSIAVKNHSHLVFNSTIFLPIPL